MQKENSERKYFIYCRKSTDTEDKQVQSIPDQIRELEKLAKEYNLEVVDVFTESMSAKKPGRPVFDKMIKRIRAGEARGLIVWKLNRLARNPVDGGAISWLIQENTIEHIQTFGRSYYPNDNVLMMQVEFGMATQYVRDLSIDTKRGIRSREHAGLPNGVASIGFLNNLLAEPGNRGWLVDSDRFPTIKQLLELYITGKYSVRQLTRIANDDMGLRTPQRRKQGGKKLVHSYIADTILKNPVYAGFFFTRDGERCELQKEIPRMITEEEYWHIQKVLGSRGRPRPNANNLPFAYTGFASCGECGGSVTAEHKYQLICPGCKHKFSYPKKETCPKCDALIETMENPTYLHYIYYHCTKKKQPTCKQGSVSETYIDTHLASYFKKNMKISQTLAEWCIKNLDMLRINDKQNESEKRGTIQSTLVKKENEYRELILMKTRGILDDEDFIIAKGPIKQEIQNLKQQVEALGGVNSTQAQKAHRAFDLALGLDEVFRNGTAVEKKEAISELGSNLTLKDKNLNVINAKKYEALINGLLMAKTKNTRFEPENIDDISDQNEVFVDVCPTLLPLLDEFRTLNWVTIKKDLEVFRGFESFGKLQLQN